MLTMQLHFKRKTMFTNIVDKASMFTNIVDKASMFTNIVDIASFYLIVLFEDLFRVCEKVQERGKVKMEAKWLFFQNVSADQIKLKLFKVTGLAMGLHYYKTMKFV